MNTLFNLLEKIKRKPALYLGNTSITDLRMFILGYRFARSEMGISNSEAESDFYKNFQHILPNLGLSDRQSWGQLVELYEGHPVYLKEIAQTINKIVAGVGFRSKDPTYDLTASLCVLCVSVVFSLLFPSFYQGG